MQYLGTVLFCLPNNKKQINRSSVKQVYDEVENVHANLTFDYMFELRHVIFLLFVF